MPTVRIGQPMTHSDRSAYDSLSFYPPPVRDPKRKNGRSALREREFTRGEWTLTTL